MNFRLLILLIGVVAASLATESYAQQSAARLWNEQLLGAIRINIPHPPRHARNLHHLATVMYDAWAAYDSTAIGYIHHERATAPGSIEDARREAISYAAYRLLKSRFATGTGAATTNAALDAQMVALGFDAGITSTVGAAPANVGNRIAATILAWGLADGSGESNGYTDPTYWNPQPAMIVLSSSGAVGGIPDFTDPNRWQPLALSAAFSQNGIPIPETIQPYVGVTWLSATPFSLARDNPNELWIDPGPPSKLGTATDATYKAGALELLIKSSQLNSESLIDISPGAFGNNPLGNDNGTGIGKRVESIFIPKKDRSFPLPEGMTIYEGTKQIGGGTVSPHERKLLQAIGEALALDDE
jgi:hypothetical protein